MSYKRQEIEKVCEVCKRDFKGCNKQKYCSRECVVKKQKEQLSTLAEYRRKCPHCGKSIGPMSGKSRVGKIAVAPTLRRQDEDEGTS